MIGYNEKHRRSTIRAILRPKAMCIILIVGLQALISIMPKGHIVALNTDSEVFLIVTTPLYLLFIHLKYIIAMK